MNPLLNRLYGDKPLPPSLSPTVDAVLERLLVPVVDLERLSRKKLLDAAEVETLYGISAATLKTKRTRGGGPDYIQGTQGGRVLYSHDAIQSWITARRKRG